MAGDEQFWPTSETFDDGTTAYGEHPDLYLSIEPWSVSPEATTGFSLKVADGQPFDAYQFAAGHDSGAAAFALRTAPGDFAAWCVERTVEQADVEVTLAPSLRVTGGQPDAESFRQVGVCAYVSGGTLTTPGGDTAQQYRTDVSGYFFVETKNAAGPHRLLLLELASGAITVLASQAVSAIDPAHAAGTALDAFPARRMRMKVEADGSGGVEINCWRRVAPNATQQPARSPEVQCFAGTIVRGTALAVGRCGFGAQTFRTQSSGAVSGMLLDLFRVRSASGATRYFTDRFQRLARRAARELSDSFLTGASLASAWIGDGKSRTGSAISNSKHLVRSTATAGEVETAADLGDSVSWPGYMLRQNPAASPSQRFGAVFKRLNVLTSVPVEMGVAVRFVVHAFGSGLIDCRGRFNANGDRADYVKTGYTAAVRYDPGAGAVWQLEIRHFDGNVNFDYQAPVLATADLGALGLAVGTSFDLDVEIRNFDGDSFGVGDFVALLVKVDAATVTPVASTSIGGLAVIDDYLIDLRSGTATMSPGGAGLVVIPDSLPASRIVSVLSFEARALTDPPISNPNEQASVPIPSEIDGATGTLVTPLDSEIAEVPEGSPVEHAFERGLEQPILRIDRERRIWQVRTPPLEQSDWSELLDFYEAHGGPSVPFNWTHPDTDEALVVHFTQTRLRLQPVHTEHGRSLQRVAFTLEELFAASTYNA